MQDFCFSGTKVRDGRMIFGDACMCDNGSVYIISHHPNCIGSENFTKVRIVPDSLRVKTIERSNC